MSSSKKVQILPYIWGKEISLESDNVTNSTNTTATSTVDEGSTIVNTFDELKKLIDSTPEDQPIYKKSETVDSVNNKLKLNNIKNNWQSRKNISKDCFLPEKSLNSVQFEVPILIVHPRTSSVESLQRIENIYQILSGDKNQQIYNKCRDYCIDGRTPPDKSIVLPKNTSIYTADLFDRRKVLYKLWKHDDPRSYNILDINIYSSIMDVSRGIIPGVLPAYLHYLKNYKYKQFNNIGLYGVDLSTLPATDQQLIKQIPGVFLCT